VVLIAPPPPTRRPRPLHARLAAGSELYRIYNPTRHNATRLGFRFVGPLVRFDHHVEGSVERGIYYAAASLESCVVEVFGDLGLVRFDELRVAKPLLRRELVLLDLRGRGALRGGTVAAIAMADHQLSQQWSRYFYEHPEIYGEVAGLIYSNAHNGADAVALYERAHDALECSATRDWRLDDPVVETELRTIAHENNLLVE
jgi:hypothetical protein